MIALTIAFRRADRYNRPMSKPHMLSELDGWLTPYNDALVQREHALQAVIRNILGTQTVTEFALGHLYYGLHKTKTEWVFREWAPHATKLYLVGDFSNWKDSPTFAAEKQGENWELHVPLNAISHGETYRLHVYWPGGSGWRIPSYANYVVQDADNNFNASVWAPEKTFRWTDGTFTPADDPPLIYEAHIGMSSTEPKVASYAEFTHDVLPRIKADGYNTVQLMAIQEHPYYGSFGYHVANFFAPSSRFGTPDDLKQLVNTAHHLGLRIVLDIVHSHAVKNEVEGLSKFDGTLTQYFYPGERGNHAAWDSRVFDYGKPQVQHFLLSNCRYWLDEFHFDGFRFDGVTSMLYRDHGLGRAFSSYDDYFQPNTTDENALAYVVLANELIHTVKPTALTIAEEMSAMPGLAAPREYGGLGFDYRLSMGVPDMWIKLLKEARDEAWNFDSIFHELTTHRPEEKTISYLESHDQALVGDKTIIFRLIDKEMYFHMQTSDGDVTVERGIALHKMLRLFTASTNGGGYLNFMGNEFGHPEWIDFPREGNKWSYQYARRRWDLADNPALKYRWLGDFDKAMIAVIRNVTDPIFSYVHVRNDQHVITFMRGNYVFAFNFSPTKSYTDYALPAANGDYHIVLSSDDAAFGGQDRVDTTLIYRAKNDTLRAYLPARTTVVFRK